MTMDLIDIQHERQQEPPEFFCLFCGEPGREFPPTRECGDATMHMWLPGRRYVTPYGAPHTGRLAGEPLPVCADVQLRGMNFSRHQRGRPLRWINHAGEWAGS